MAGLDETDLQNVRVGVMRDYHGTGVNARVEAQLERAIEVQEPGL